MFPLGSVWFLLAEPPHDGDTLLWLIRVGLLGLEFVLGFGKAKLRGRGVAAWGAVWALVLAFALGGCSAVEEAASLPDTGAAAAPVASQEEPSAAEAEGAADEAAAAAAVEEPQAPITDTLTVRFIDVGQGDCALLTCGGQSLLIDGGPREASSKLYAILEQLGISRLDYIVCSHPDEDHCGGIAGALNFATCDTFFCSVTEHDTKTFANVLKYLGDTPVTVPSAGDSFSLGQATVTFVGPVEPTRDENEGSLVCRVDLGESSFLFTGDAGETSEYLMVSAGAPLDVDVLKVGHHGSAGSSSDIFLAAVTPEYAVVSVGKSNSYGHPTEEALERLKAAGAEILRTDERGTIALQATGDGAITQLADAGFADEAVDGAAYEAVDEAFSQEPVAPAAPTETSASEEAAPQNERTVYVAASGKGKKYHSRPDCSNMKGTKELTEEEALAQDYTPCKKCW